MGRPVLAALTRQLEAKKCRVYSGPLRIRCKLGEQARYFQAWYYLRQLRIYCHDRRRYSIEAILPVVKSSESNRFSKSRVAARLREHAGGLAALAVAATFLGCSAEDTGNGSSGGANSSSGGVSNGGSSGTGGRPGAVAGSSSNSGGAAGGGGAPGSAGTAVTTGGSVSAGGSVSSGGSVNAGGSVSSGGSVSVGGSVNSGGVSASGSTNAGGSVSSGGGVNSGGSVSVGGTSSNGGTATAPAVRFIGRMDKRDAAGPRFAWSGSGVVARFDGTSVGVKLTGNQQYTVVVDGTVRPKLVSTSGTTPIVQGLAAGVHVVELYRRTEASQGEAQFLGFDFGAGQLLSPPAAKTRKIEIVGDSISCGYGNEGADMNCPFSADTENHYLSYGALAARNLDAELVTIAWSGKGAVCNYGDDASSCVDPLPSVYDRSLPNRADSSWDFSSWQPDAVVINLGTNDFSTATDPSQSEFETGYKTFVQHIRSKYQSAFILLTNGSMLAGADLDKVRLYLGNVAKSLNDAGDSKVKAFELDPQNAADGYGCDWHPSQATHRKMADKVTSVLRTTLGW